MTDTMIYPLAVQLRTCLCEALATNPNPPLNCCLRTGDVIYADFNQIRDECCEGLAYVKVSRIFPSASSFPAQDEEWVPCHPLAWGAELEMGVWRCEPQQTVTDLPSCEEWETVTQQVANDWEAMTRAMCCLKDLMPPGEVIFSGTWAPLNSGGGCVGGSMTILVGVLACAC